MKDQSSKHMKVQQLADCYAQTDYLSEMAGIEKGKAEEDSALKWIALTVLHGVNDSAEKISITRTKDGKIQVMAKYREKELPSPGKAVGDGIFEAINDIVHFDNGNDKEKRQLVMGLRDSSVNMTVKVKKDGKKENVTFSFDR